MTPPGVDSIIPRRAEMVTQSSLQGRQTGANRKGVFDADILAGPDGPNG